MNEVDVETIGKVRTENPTAQRGGQAAVPSFDKVGRQVMTLHQVRDLVGTMTATIQTNEADNETTLLAGVAGELHDLVYVTGANSSDAAIRIVFRDGTGGANLFELSVPANDTREIHFEVPYKQSEADMSWVVDWAVNAAITDDTDVTNTTFTVSGQYVTNV